MTQKSLSTYDLPSHMVSYPQPADHALTTRRPASVTSRSTTTRRHRSSRSQTGGASFRPQNEFPNFAQTGDVEIVINADGQEKRYMLHRLILAQCSGFFEASTSEDWSRAQAQGVTSTVGPPRSGLAKIGEDDEYGRERETGRPTLPAAPARDRHRWRYELDWGNKDDELPLLVQKVSADFDVQVQSLIAVTACHLVTLRRRPDLPSTSSPQQVYHHSVEWLLSFFHGHAIRRTYTPSSPRQ